MAQYEFESAGLNVVRTWPQSLSEQGLKRRHVPHVDRLRSQFSASIANTEQASTGHNRTAKGYQASTPPCGPIPETLNFWDSYAEVRAEASIVIARFCSTAGSKLRQRPASSPDSTAIFLYDVDSSGQLRCSDISVDHPEQLAFLLKEERFRHVQKPDADRRLITIFNACPGSLLAVGNTAPQSQLESFSSAMYTYISIRPSLHVAVPICARGLQKGSRTSGPRKFDLRFTFLYPLLRRIRGSETMKPRSDVSFLFQDTDGSHRMLRMRADAISVCGTSNSEWTALNLLSSARDSHHDQDEDDEEEIHGEIDDHPVDPDDILTTRLADLHHFRVHRDITDPREYYFRTVAYIVEHGKREWIWTTYCFVESIRYHLCQADQIRMGQRDGRGHDEYNVLEVMDLIRKASERISECSSQLEATLHLWDVFRCNGGRSGFFLHGELSGILVPIIDDIDGKFDELRAVKHQLDSVDRDCQRCIHNLGIRLQEQQFNFARYSNRQSKHNELIATMRLLVTVGIIIPGALSTAFFAMPEGVIPFNINFRTFMIAYGILASVLSFFTHALPFAVVRLLDLIKGVRREVQLDLETNEPELAIPGMFAK